ncbi:MAG TPA: glutamate--cysteine ligase [Thiotrichales bacterium]|nr:glutamate--cysteine ligase [Thiotrichales bacterium]
MGQEIRTHDFTDDDFEAFRRRLRDETELLARLAAEGGMAEGWPTAGFELEVWLVDRHWRPAAINERFLERMQNPLVTHELSRYNLELNGAHLPLREDLFSAMSAELDETLAASRRVAESMAAELVCIGILPSLEPEMLDLEAMSRLERYRALNEQVFRLRGGRPLLLDIVGHDHLRREHHDVMLEAAATSFQLHLQVPASRAVRFYNASLLASAYTVALGANSPWLFGFDLWDETRIPLFEQSVDVGGYAGARGGPLRRVTFGSGYLRDSLVECFRENEEHFPVLLPMVSDDDPLQFSHLRLHNGTIWRWNRPLVGFDGDGRPHLRIEHRVMPGGPTVEDMFANAAFYYGLVAWLADMRDPPEAQLPFSQVRDNFYLAARHGLQAQIRWLDGQRGTVAALLEREVLAMARAGLRLLEVAPEEIRRFMGVVEARVRTGQNGAAWQRRWVAKHGREMVALTAAYAERQWRGEPVHGWDV